MLAAPDVAGQLGRLPERLEDSALQILFAIAAIVAISVASADNRQDVLRVVMRRRRGPRRIDGTGTRHPWQSFGKEQVVAPHPTPAVESDSAPDIVLEQHQRQMQEGPPQNNTLSSPSLRYES